MKTITMLAMVLLMSLLTGAVWAEEKGSANDEWADFRMMMTERNKMVRSVMTMTRETMMIVKNLDHRPSAADKKKLDEMIKDIDELIANDVEVGKKMMKKWQKKDWGDSRMDENEMH